MVLRTAPRVARTGQRRVAQTATSSAAVRVGRVGFVARGAVYVLVGWLSLMAAVGIGGAAAADKQAALEALGSQPQGLVLVGIVGVGLFAYAVWSFVRAIFDPERRGHKAGGVVMRIGYAVAGTSYGGLAIAAAQFALGSGSAGKGSDASTQDWTARLLEAPFGPALVIAVGASVLAIAAYEFGSALKGSFLKDLNLTAVGVSLRSWVAYVGRIGLAARGVVFAMVGIFLIQAALHNNAGEAVGLGGALQKLADQPYGAIALGVVAAGLCLYGLYSFVEARYRRLAR